MKNDYEMTTSFEERDRLIELLRKARTKPWTLDEGGDICVDATDSAGRPVAALTTSSCGCCGSVANGSFAHAELAVSAVEFLAKMLNED